MTLPLCCNKWLNTSSISFSPPHKYEKYGKAVAGGLAATLSCWEIITFFCFVSPNDKQNILAQKNHNLRYMHWENAAMVYNVILLSVSLSWATVLLSASLLSILSSQLISKPFVSLSMQGLHKSSHEGIGKMGRQQGRKTSEWGRDKLISDLKWQFD